MRQQCPLGRCHSAAAAGAPCSMDVIGHKYDSFVQRELQRRAAASRKEGMQVSGVLPAEAAAVLGKGWQKSEAGL